MAININAKTTGVGGLETSADNSGDINIQSGGSTVMNVTSSGVAVTGSFSQNGAVYSTQPTFRNLIINGDMKIAQRGTSFTGLTNNTYNIYTLDRWYSEETQTSTFVADITQDTDAPSGFKRSFKVNVTTPQASLISNQQILLEQRIEAYNVSHLAYGSSYAKSLTLSFWVKSSVTGTYTVWFYNNQNGRMISRQYTVDSANTWEQKTMTIPGDTGGSSIADNNSTGLYVRFLLGAGSDYTGSPLQTSWTAVANSGRYTNQTNLMATSGATFYITGVQLEVGSTATEFEHLPVDVELARCQRYFQQVSGENTSTGGLGCAYHESATSSVLDLRLNTQMRALPTATVSAASDFVFNTPSNASAPSSISFYAHTLSSVRLRLVHNSDSYHARGIRFGTTSGRINADAEL